MVCENHYFYVAHPHAKIEWALKPSARKNRKSQKKNKTSKPNPNTSQPPPPSSLVDPPLPSPPVVVPHLPSLPAMDPHRRRSSCLPPPCRRRWICAGEGGGEPLPASRLSPPPDPHGGGQGRAAPGLPLEPVARSARGRAEGVAAFSVAGACIRRSCQISYRSLRRCAGKPTVDSTACRPSRGRRRQSRLLPPVEPSTCHQQCPLPAACHAAHYRPRRPPLAARGE